MLWSIYAVSRLCTLQYNPVVFHFNKGDAVYLRQKSTKSLEGQRIITRSLSRKDDYTLQITICQVLLSETFWISFTIPFLKKNSEDNLVVIDLHFLLKECDMYKFKITECE